MADWIGKTFTSDAGWNHLKTLVDIGNRMSGSNGERQAAVATRDALADVGARNTSIETFDIQGWERGSSSIEVAESKEECIALPRSPSGERTAELVDIGYGLPSDFEKHDCQGKVVMVDSNVPHWFDRYIHRREKYYRAVDDGAAAFVYKNHVEGCLAPTGSVGTTESPIGDILAVGVSKEVGSRLSRRWEGGEVTVQVEAETSDSTSQNVHADIGPDTTEAILLTSHVDAHDIAEGAGDNGAGTAVVVEVSNALAEREPELDTRVHVIVFGAEEVGLLGSTHDSEQRDSNNTKAVINNDGVVRGRTLDLVTNGFDALGSAAEMVSDRFDHPIESSPNLGIHSDHWPYVVRGVPGYQATSETDYEGRGWGHTRADTIDKLESRVLREQAILLTELTVNIADDELEVDHRDPKDIAEQLEDEDKGEGMRVIGDWPY